MKNLKTEGEKFFKNEAEEWKLVSKGILRQFVGYNSHLMMVKVKFEEGAVGYVHDHFHSQATYVASGSFEIEINGEKQILKQGDGFFVQPSLRHGAKCLAAGVLVDVFNPVREDFIK